jgi:signal transduction histidine kinase
MNERVRELGGKLELSSTDQGTTVTATVPTRQPEDRALHSTANSIGERSMRPTT